MSIDSPPTLIVSPPARPVPPVSRASHAPLPASARCAKPSRSGKRTAQASTLARIRKAKKRAPKRCASERRTGRTAPFAIGAGGAALLRRHAQRAVEADGLAVEHRVLDDVARQGGELARLAEAARNTGLRGH